MISFPLTFFGCDSLGAHRGVKGFGGKVCGEIFSGAGIEVSRIVQIDDIFLFSGLILADSTYP
jgi:hypothetical protein